MTNKKKILVVDDDKLVRVMVGDIFSKEFSVLLAEDGAQAIEVLEKESVCAIVCDHNMPKVTGVEVLEKARTLRPQAARILVTATDKIQDLGDAINRARVHAFMMKPVRALEIESAVKSAVREIELEEENKRLVGELRQAHDELKVRERELEHELAIRNEELKEVMRQLAR